MARCIPNTIAYSYDSLSRLVSETAKDLADEARDTRQTMCPICSQSVDSRAVTKAGKTLTTYYKYDANDRLLMESNVVATASGGAFFVPRVGGPAGERPLAYDFETARVCYYLVKVVPYGILFALLLPGLALLRRRQRLAVLTLVRYNFAARPKPYSAGRQVKAFNGASIGKGHLAEAKAAINTGLAGAKSAFQNNGDKATAAALAAAATPPSEMSCWPRSARQRGVDRTGAPGTPAESDILN